MRWCDVVSPFKEENGKSNETKEKSDCNSGNDYKESKDILIEVVNPVIILIS